jgi:hypothetical protein
MTNIESSIKESQEIVEKCCECLAGHEPEVQSVALADLTAIWLAGYNLHTKKATNRLREDLLANFITCVRSLIPINEETLKTRKERLQ